MDSTSTLHYDGNAVNYYITFVILRKFKMVRYTQGHKEETRARIVDAAGRGFRKQGYAGIGVDGLAREAGVTHGGFYGHFGSKAEAFVAAVAAGLQELRAGVEAVRAEHGAGWVGAFAAFYMGRKRTCNLADACTLPSLSVEIERSDPAARAAYQTELLRVMEAVAAGLPGETDAERTARAWVLLSLLAGGVTLARAVPDQAVAEQIAAAIQKAASVFAESGSFDAAAASTEALDPGQPISKA
ncbi:TetR/AcrR family transcriptional regulator [Janthinobacterium fluminis]|uniref:TetR/AcrR family transcriptional regulator n=1 Tax=Janthinobacterium fluminis TaxID=2987524 RepID=A0ABT5JVZ3_9BURK|nr:TetR/AcrR family transcriptional regulator [Janthinobacterium fluminis]MDC8756905.1 TetR/AcrR family transcriptional regulator [Janthinobacterium fluminis]